MKRQTKLRRLVLFLGLSFFLIGFIPINQVSAETETPTSIILLIGDGMGMDQIEFGRLVEYGPSGTSAIQEFPHETTVKTVNINGITTDSAASGTAISTGVKTSNGRIGKTAINQDLTTILELAKENDYATGLVSISQICHATPASFAAHNINRNNYIEISDDIAKLGVDLLFGGGSDNEYFGTQVTYLEGQGYSYITQGDQLSSLSSTPALGLFASGHIPYEYQRTLSTTAPHLSEMAETSIELLNNTGKPFFLMIEGSAIDWAGHSNNQEILAHEVIEFEKTVSYVKDLAEQDSSLQVLVTADHECGGFSINSYESLSTAIPSEYDALETKIQKRTDRANEIDASWSTGGHTSAEVILAGMGPYTEYISSAEHHTDTFSIMRRAIDGKTGPIDGEYNYFLFYVLEYGGIVLGVAAIVTLSVFVIRKVKKKNSKVLTKIKSK